MLARCNYIYRPIKKPITIPTKYVPKRKFFTIVPAYKSGIRLTLGKYSGEVNPGFRLDIPFVHDIYLLDNRDIVGTIPKMQVISADNVTFEVDASIQYKIRDSKKALLNVRHIDDAVIERCKMELRNTLSSMKINETLEKKSDISRIVSKALIDIEQDWGVSIWTIQIRDIKFDESMKQAMSTVAEATRQAEAKIINAKADIETAKRYSEAAQIYSENPMTVRLREFQLWNSVSKNPSTTIYVVPSNLLDFAKSMKDPKC